MVVTPVAPHFSLDRSLVLTDTQEVKVEVVPDRTGALVIDGQDVGRLKPGATVTCTVAERPGASRPQRAAHVRHHPALPAPGPPGPVRQPC